MRFISSLSNKINRNKDGKLLTREGVKELNPSVSVRERTKKYRISFYTDRKRILKFRIHPGVENDLSSVPFKLAIVKRVFLKLLERFGNGAFIFVEISNVAQASRLQYPTLFFLFHFIRFYF